MEVRRNVLAIHDQAQIAVADRLPVDFQITQQLVVCSVLPDDVDHMLDRASVGSEARIPCKPLRRRLHPVVGEHGHGHRFQILLRALYIHLRKGPVQQRRNVRKRLLEPGASGLRRRLLREIVWPCAGSLARRYIQFAAGQRHSCRKPLRRDKADRLNHSLSRRAPCQLARIEHRHRIGPHVRHIHPAAIRAHRQRLRLRAEEALPWQPHIEVALQLEAAVTQIERRYRVPIAQRRIQRFPVRTHRQRIRMRPRPHRIIVLQQRQLAPHYALRQVELHHLAAVPQSHKRPPPILSHCQRDRVHTRHHVGLAQVEPRLYLAGCRIHQPHVVRKIASH